MHLFSKQLDYGAGMPLKEPAYAFQQPVVFLPADLAAARGAALAQVVHEAGALIAGDGLMDILFAVPDRKYIPYGRKRILQAQARKIRAEVLRAVLFDLAHDFKPWKILLCIQPYIRKMLVVL